MNCFTRLLIAILLLHTGLRAQSRPPVPSPLLITDLRCDAGKNVFGMDDPQPRFSWVLMAGNPKNRNLFQQACQIQVGSTLAKLRSGMADIWDSQKSESGIAGRRFRGVALNSSTKYFWRVRVWERSGAVSSWSKPAVFTTGLLNASDWKGSWVTDSKPLPQTDSDRYGLWPAPLFRRDFKTKKTVRRAFLYVAGLGYNEVYLNGQQVGDRMLEPGWTDYRKRIFYSSYDVTALVRQGNNALGVWLGNGWYNPLPMHMWGRFNLRDALSTGQPAFLLQLAVEFGDGSTEEIVSNSDWRVKDSYILKNNLYLGEWHDLQKKDSRWDEPGHWSGDWRKVEVTGGPGGALMNNPLPPVRMMEELKPVRIGPVANLGIVADFGKNFAGTIRMIVRGERGQRLRVRYGELLKENGDVNVMTSVAGQIKSRGIGGPGAPDTAMHEDLFVLSGLSDTLQPRFSYTGYRYARLSGLKPGQQIKSIRGLKMYSSVDRTGMFSCSDTLVNRIYQNSINSFTSNLHSVQSDCPHRERFGYGGDIAVTANSFMLNFDMRNFYRKTLDDYTDAQRSSGAFTETSPYVGISDEGLTPEAGPVGWGYVYPVLMDALFRYTADTLVIEKGYPHLKAWVDYLHQHARNLVIDKGISDHESLDPKPVAVTETLFFYASADRLADFAGLLGHSEDAASYSKLAANIRDTIIARFLNPSTGVVDIGTEAAQAFPLYFHIVPESMMEPVMTSLLKAIESKHDHLSTGMFGSLYMLKVLSAHGHQDKAWQIAEQKTFPGWGYMVANGATSVWEHWAFSDNTYSHNHAMWGSICEWYISDLAGIAVDPQAAGFNKVTVRPMGLANLDSLQYSYYSPQGPIAIRWNKIRGGKEIFLTVPVNCSADIRIPLAAGQRIDYDGQSSTAVAAPDFFRLTTGSGRYHFVIRQNVTN